MALNRRELHAGTGGGLVSAPATAQDSVRPAAAPDFATIRKDFPWIENQTYIDNAGVHPVSAPAARVIEQHLSHKVRGPRADRLFIAEPEIEELKALYGRLVNAKSTEVALVPSTLAGENVVAAGLGLHRGAGNVVTDEFHYHGGTYIYRQLEGDWRSESSNSTTGAPI